MAKTEIAASACPSENSRLMTNRIVVLSGPSGSGKTTVVNRLVNQSEISLVKSISATTRPPRPAEQDGEDYYFLTDEEFRQRLSQDDFIEHAEVFSSGFFYGTLRTELNRAWDQGSWAFLEIDVEGALNVMRQYPDAVTIFLRTPSPEEFERRLRARGTENEETIQKRLATAARELEYADRYRYAVINETNGVDQTVDQICEILKSEETSKNA